MTASCPSCGVPWENHPGIALTCKTLQLQRLLNAELRKVDAPRKTLELLVRLGYEMECLSGSRCAELLGEKMETFRERGWVQSRIREAMKSGTFTKLKGEVEVDETFVGGKAKNMHKHKREKAIDGRGPSGKTAVQGILERGGEVKTMVVPNTEGETLRSNVLRNVDRSATVYTDALPAYEDLKRAYLHMSIDHFVAYVKDRIHTNGIENFWSLLKRALKGTYTKCAPFHLHRYCDEESWRFNNRKTGDGGRFEALLKMVVGRRLTWRQLCMIGDAGFMGIE